MAKAGRIQASRVCDTEEVAGRWDILDEATDALLEMVKDRIDGLTTGSAFACDHDLKV